MTDAALGLQTCRPPSRSPVSTPGRGAAAPELAGRVLPGSAPRGAPAPLPLSDPGPGASPGGTQTGAGPCCVISRFCNICSPAWNPLRVPSKPSKASRGLPGARTTWMTRPCPAFARVQPPRRASPRTCSRSWPGGSFPRPDHPSLGLCALASLGCPRPTLLRAAVGGADRWKAWRHSQALPSSDPQLEPASKGHSWFSSSSGGPWGGAGWGGLQSLHPQMRAGNPGAQHGSSFPQIHQPDKPLSLLPGQKAPRAERG